MEQRQSIGDGGDVLRGCEGLHLIKGMQRPDHRHSVTLDRSRRSIVVARHRCSGCHRLLLLKETKRKAELRKNFRGPTIVGRPFDVLLCRVVRPRPFIECGRCLGRHRSHIHGRLQLGTLFAGAFVVSIFSHELLGKKLCVF